VGLWGLAEAFEVRIIGSVSIAAPWEAIRGGVFVERDGDATVRSWGLGCASRASARSWLAGGVLVGNGVGQRAGGLR
jgi:hypothetical protein